jgi:hypothetical protein
MTPDESAALRRLAEAEPKGPYERTLADGLLAALDEIAELQRRAEAAEAERDKLRSEKAAATWRADGPLLKREADEALQQTRAEAELWKATAEQLKAERDKLLAECDESRGEIAHSRHVYAHCFYLARDFVAAHKAADTNDLELLVGSLLRELNELKEFKQVVERGPERTAGDDFTAWA